MLGPLHECVLGYCCYECFMIRAGLGSLNKVMRSKLNSAMSVPVWAQSRATAHIKTVLLQYLSKSKCFQNRHSAWCIWLWNWMKWLKCKRKSGTLIWKCPFLFCILNKLLQCSKHYAGSLYVYCGPLSLKSAALCSITRRLLLIDEDKVGPCQPCRQRDGQEFADSCLQNANCCCLLVLTSDNGPARVTQGEGSVTEENICHCPGQSWSANQRQRRGESDQWEARLCDTDQWEARWCDTDPWAEPWRGSAVS